jgi:hypothetical protein
MRDRQGSRGGAWGLEREIKAQHHESIRICGVPAMGEVIGDKLGG